MSLHKDNLRINLRNKQINPNMKMGKGVKAVSKHKKYKWSIKL